MKKIYSLLLFVLFGALFTIQVYAQPAEKLKVYYYRYDGHENTHTAWIWPYMPTAGDGVEFTFTQEGDTNWLSLEVDLKTDGDGRFSNCTDLGIIIKEGTGWGGQREPGGDRFFNLSKNLVNGTSHVYFVQTDATVYYTEEETPTDDKILDAAFKKDSTISIAATNVALKYNLYENGEIVKSEVPTEKRFTIDYNADIKKHYEVELIFEDDIVSRSEISLRNLYETEAFNDLFYYDGQLGLILEGEVAKFRIWTPVSENVNLLLYEDGHPHYNQKGEKTEKDTPLEVINMTATQKGVWEVEVELSEALGKYYTFELEYGGQKHEIVDPYAYSTGANGLRALVVDFEKTNPKEWGKVNKPDTIENLTDYIIYELHVRDLTTHPSWNGPEKYRGKYLGVATPNTSYTVGDLTVSTGLDHLADLGVNAVHFLPIFDYGYVDETRLDDKEYMAENGFNWGYMPNNFNTPEGVYSTNPFDGHVRMYELKHMIMNLHKRGIRVIMDVVYNHFGTTEGSQFEKSMPGYYFRQWSDGSYSNGSGTGNEMASERAMFRKYMVDSILYWAKEYKISGFRFDLMALHDVETMNYIREKVNEVDPSIILYGEPWSAGDTPLSETKRADKNNMGKLNQVASFNDNTRDVLKHNWASGTTTSEQRDTIRYAVAGAVEGIEHARADKNHTSYHKSPDRLINYVSAHDDETLRDFIDINHNLSGEKLKAACISANSIVLTSQGIPFLHAGVDLLRSKEVPEGVKYDENDNRVQFGLAANSYNLADAVNQLDWNWKIEHYDSFLYYKNLIGLRRTFDNLRFPTAEEIKENLTFFDTDSNNISYKIKGTKTSPELVIIHTSDSFSRYTAEKDYIVLNNKKGNILNMYGRSKLQKGEHIDIVDQSTLILVEESDKFDYNLKAEARNFFDDTVNITVVEYGKNTGLSGGAIAGITIAVIAAIAIIATSTIVIVKKKKASENV